MRTPLRFQSSFHAFFVAALALCVAPLAAQERLDPPSALALRHRAEVGRLYASSTWPSGEPRSGVSNELAFPGWAAGALQAERGLLVRNFRRAGDEKAAPSFVLETCVEDTAELAHERLLDWLSGLQSAEAMPSLSQLGLALGDAGYAGRSGAGPSTLAWIAFVRGNVAVRVSACDAVREPELDLAGIAGVVDQTVRAAPALEAGLAPRKPRIDGLVAARASVVAGAVVRVDFALTDPAGGRAHLEWTVGGPGQGYVEQAQDGTWQLHTTGPGAITLALEATGSNGTWTRAETQLVVQDD